MILDILTECKGNPEISSPPVLHVVAMFCLVYTFDSGSLVAYRASEAQLVCSPIPEIYLGSMGSLENSGNSQT